MAAGSIPCPGKKYGPCPKACEHVDCKQSREMASAECPICGKAIGYEVYFYLDSKNAGKPTHAVCLEEKIEKERSSNA
jgi:hypothetical protein